MNRVHHSISLRSNPGSLYDFKSSHDTVYDNPEYFDGSENWPGDFNYAAEMPRSISREEWYKIWHLARKDERNARILVLMVDTMQKFNRINGILWIKYGKDFNDYQYTEKLETFEGTVDGLSEAQLDKIEEKSTETLEVFYCPLTCFKN